jgi:hypothetical protein
MVGDPIKLPFHGLVLPQRHDGIAGKDASQRRQRVTANHQKDTHRHHHEDLLGSTQGGEVAQSRDQIECVPQSLEHLGRQRLARRIQRDHPNRAEDDRHRQ